MKQETFYVKITGCSESNWWYLDHIGETFPVNNITPSGDYTFTTMYGKRDFFYIRKSDCRRVYLKEQETDVDGEPLVCGDKINPVGVKEKYVAEYFFSGFDGKLYYCCRSGSCFSFLKVRKVKPEPVDPIEEVWKKWNKTIFAKDSLDYTKMLENCLDDLSKAIKQHIENKKEEKG